MRDEYPELKQIAELTPSDFDRHAVWVAVMHFDEGQPWYERADEETYRPWTGTLPFEAAAGRALVIASLQLHDGTSYRGCVTPVETDWDIPPRPGLPSFSERYGGSPLMILGLQQPQIFVNDRIYTFWGGRLGISDERCREFYECMS